VGKMRAAGDFVSRAVGDFRENFDGADLRTVMEYHCTRLDNTFWQYGATFYHNDGIGATGADYVVLPKSAKLNVFAVERRLQAGDALSPIACCARREHRPIVLRLRIALE